MAVPEEADSGRVSVGSGVVAVGPIVMAGGRVVVMAVVRGMGCTRWV